MRNLTSVGVVREPPAPVVSLERHFAPQQLAELWGLDQSTIRRLFQDEPGVFRLGKANRRDGRRDYVTLRIPASVAARVHERLSRSPWRGTH